MSLTHPLKQWLINNGYGNPDTGIVSIDDYRNFADKLPSHPGGDHLRFICAGYRPPGWDLAFEIEAVTNGEVSAHDLRDKRWLTGAA